MVVPADVVAKFAEQDKQGCGTIGRSHLIQILGQLGPFNESSAARLVEQYESPGQDVVQYRDFIRWLFRDDQLDPKAQRALTELEAVAENLDRVAANLSVQLPDAASTLLSQVKVLKSISNNLRGRTSDEASMQDVFRNAQLEGNTDSSDASQFRKQAAEVMECSGARGTMVDDLEELPVLEANDKLALTYFRFCHGLKLYRSTSISKAMRLICSAPVPGLGKTTYMDVFRGLTKQPWDNHVFVKGGLVRDILRRNIGADVDVSFTAPVNELGAICKQRGWVCGVYDAFNYMYIGDKSGEEYLEGLPLYHECSEPDFHADFAMNTLLYDFCNDVIVDRYGIGVPAVINNRVSIPRIPAHWDNWVKTKGLAGLFRFYKFLLRGYTYEESEMTYIVDRILGFWAKDAADTVQEGQRALIGLVECKDSAKIESLKSWVYTSFEKATSSPTSDGSGGSGASFSSAELWWQDGWRPMLKLS